MCRTSPSSGHQPTSAKERLQARIAGHKTQTLCMRGALLIHPVTELVSYGHVGTHFGYVGTHKCAPM